MKIYPMINPAKKAALAFRNALNLVDIIWARYRKTEPRYLPLLMLFITYRCNLRCAMCGIRYNCSEQSLEQELVLSDYEKILHDARRLNTTLMSISGGEALARGDLPFEIIRLGRTLGIEAHLCTNGYYITEEKARHLGDCGLRSISVSLESPLEHIHDQLRGAGSFNQAVNAIRLVRKHAPEVKVGINYTITSANYRNLADMVAFAEALKVHQLKFAPVHTNLLHSQKPSNDFEELLFKEEYLSELEDEVNRLKIALRQSSLLSNHPFYLNRLVPSFTSPQAFRCYAGYAICTVDPVGDVSPCPDIKGNLNLREHSLFEIWRSPDFQHLRRQACECGHRCWDPFYTEVSLRLGTSSLLRSSWQLWQEFIHYYGHS